MVSLSIWSLIYSRLPIYLYLYCSLLFDLARDAYASRVTRRPRRKEPESMGTAQLRFERLLAELSGVVLAGVATILRRLAHGCRPAQLHLAEHTRSRAEGCGLAGRVPA